MKLLTDKATDICYCSKDCYFDYWVGLITLIPCGIKVKTIFEKGKGYEFFYEDVNTIWVFYNKDGEPGYQGCRFYVTTQYGNLHSFDVYFNKIILRKLKLEKLNRINGELE